MDSPQLKIVIEKQDNRWAIYTPTHFLSFSAVWIKRVFLTDNPPPMFGTYHEAQKAFFESDPPQFN